MFKIRFKPNHSIIMGIASSIERARIKLAQIEQNDKRNHWFVPDSYEIIETPARPSPRRAFLLPRP